MAFGLRPDAEPSLIKWAPVNLAPTPQVASLNPNFMCSEKWFRADEAPRRPASPPSDFRRSQTFSMFEWPEAAPLAARGVSPPKQQKSEASIRAPINAGRAQEQKCQQQVVKEFERSLTADRRTSPSKRTCGYRFQERSSLPFRRLDCPDPALQGSGRFSYGGAAGARSLSPTIRDSEGWWPKYTWRSLQERNASPGRSPQQVLPDTSGITKAVPTLDAAQGGRRHGGRKNELSPPRTAPESPSGKRRDIVIEPGATGCKPHMRAERRHLTTPQPPTPQVCSRKLSPPSSPRLDSRREEKKTCA